MQTFYDFRLRVLLAAILVTASLICTVLALPRGRAQSRCKSKQDGAYDECCKQHNNCVTDASGSWLKPCADYASGVYDKCMKNYGYSAANPVTIEPPTTVGNNPGTGSTPTQ